MKYLFFIVLSLFTFSFGYSQKSYAVSFSDLDQKMAQQPRPVLVKMYTDWCAVCKMQDRQIDKDTALQQLLAKDYYYIEFNAESREPITFNGTTYKFVPHGTGGLHELAAKLGDAKASYPCWVLLSPGYKVLARQNGLLKSSELIAVLSQFRQP